MQTFALETITQAALAAGLPEGRVIDIVKKDNLTLERPRVEIQFLPETYTRSGRTLAFERTKSELRRKRELYTVQFSVAANVLAEDREWLAAFCYGFVAALPSGANDPRGNWVRVRAEKATFGKAPDKRVGDTVIEVFKRFNQFFDLSFTWRVTEERARQLIPTFTIETSIGGRHGKKPGEESGSHPGTQS